MSNSAREPLSRIYGRDSNQRKEVLTFDLNAPPTEAFLLEAIVPGNQATLGDGLYASPIDVEAIEDDVEILPNFSLFPQATNRRRRTQPIFIVEDQENCASRSGTLNRNNKRERPPTSEMAVDCDIYENLKDQFATRRIFEWQIRKEAKVSFPEPVKVVQKEPTFTCPVCISEMVEPCSTNCGHMFCQNCIKLSVQKMKKCPTCRKSLNMKSFHRVYLPKANCD